MKPFETYLRLLLESHTLMEAGQGENERANDLREQMEEPWYQLSHAEQTLIDHVSEALYGDEQSKQNIEALYKK